jgi:arylsulfatase B
MWKHSCYKLPVLLFSFSFSWAVGSVQEQQETPPSTKHQPHVLLIVADDLGYNDVGFHQNKKSLVNPNGHPTTNAAAGIMSTPTLDRLASEGVQLENYYVQPLCSPTRATIMTGRYPFHTGIGPDVDRIDWPVGVPKREVFFPQLLQQLGYKTHMVGKWHLGACHPGYLPTYRGFDSYVGYLAGGQGYYNQAYDRNATNCNMGQCLGPNYRSNYSSVFFANEATRIVQHHSATARDDPLFLYLAFQSVHNPYDDPPIDVDALFPEIVDRTRRIYAGMIWMMDRAVQQVVEAFQTYGLWEDTVVIFTADNGGIGPGSNYPLRGTKVHHWEGGIKAAAFVRGTNNENLKPLPNPAICTGLLHSTDWFKTIVEDLAGGTVENKTLPLDGFNQWELLSGKRSNDKNPRTTIVHNLPVQAKPIPSNATDPSRQTHFSTSSCMSHIDKRIQLPCGTHGITGGAIRHLDWKLLIGSNNPNASLWGDSTPIRSRQIPPGGLYPNNTRVFQPVTKDTFPEPYLMEDYAYFLFDLSKDPTETVNLAKFMPVKLQEMLALYKEYAKSAVPSLTDPQHNHNPGETSSEMMRGSRDLLLAEEETCMGPFLDSEYCAYGHEFECYVMGQDIFGNDIRSSNSSTTVSCQDDCRRQDGCSYWVLVQDEGKENACRLKSEWGGLMPCRNCFFGPKECPI